MGMRSIRDVIGGFLLVLGMFCFSARGIYLSAPVLNPETYPCASGDYVLSVNPTDMHGRGPADYTLRQSGEVVWSNRLPFTFWQAVAADSGRVAGYAFSFGWRGLSKDGYKAGPGELCVVLIDPDGTVVTNHVYERARSRMMDSPAEPLVRGIYLDEKENRFLVHVLYPSDKAEVWWVYSLLTGEQLSDIDVAVFMPTDYRMNKKFAPDIAVADTGETEMPEAVLARQGTCRLEHKGADGQDAHIEVFEFSEQGSVAMLCCKKDDIPYVTLVSTEGETRGNIQLPVDGKPRDYLSLALGCVGGQRFVAALSEKKPEYTVEWFLLDFDENTVIRLTNTVSPAVDAVAGFPDGTFVALATEYRKYSMRNGLYLFDENGNLQWKRQAGGFSHQPEELLSPEDITRTGSNAFAVLDNIRHTIQVFDTDNCLVEFIDLDETWNRKPNYPTDISSDVNSGWVVYDFGATNPFVRVDSNGYIHSESRPRLDGGRPFRIRDGIKCSSGGEYWTCDGVCVLKLSTNGHVEKVLGRKPDPEILVDPSCVHVDQKGNTYIADRRTRSVHVFDPAGREKGVCVPQPGDLLDRSSVTHITTADDGSIMFPLQYGDRRYLTFDQNCDRIGWITNRVDSSTQKLYCMPEGDDCWVAGYRQLFLLSGMTNVVRVIDRRADNRWLETLRPVAVAGDGSLAVAARNRHEVSINIYSPTGDALATFILPGKDHILDIAYDGKYVYVRRKDDLLVLEQASGMIHSINMQQSDIQPEWHGPFFVNSTQEIWFVSFEDMTIYKYNPFADDA